MPMMYPRSSGSSTSRGSADSRPIRSTADHGTTLTQDADDQVRHTRRLWQQHGWEWAAVTAAAESHRRDSAPAESTGTRRKARGGPPALDVKIESSFVRRSSSNMARRAGAEPR